MDLPTSDRRIQRNLPAYRLREYEEHESAKLHDGLRHSQSSDPNIYGKSPHLVTNHLILA